MYIKTYISGTTFVIYNIFCINVQYYILGILGDLLNMLILLYLLNVNVLIIFKMLNVKVHSKYIFSNRYFDFLNFTAVMKKKWDDKEKQRYSAVIQNCF